jgi:hypothetical protein
MSTIAGIAFEELAKRIRRDAKPGRPLVGLKFLEDFAVRNEGHDSLPRVYVTEYSDKEVPAGGAPTNSSDGINMVVRQSATVVLQLVTELRNGWQTGSDVTNPKKMGLLSLKDLLMDCIEKNDAGDPDCSLNGALEKPITFACRASGVFDLGLVVEVVITLDGLRMNRTTRSSPVATT